MNDPYLITGPRNPLVRLLAALVGMFVMVGAFFLGLAAIAIAVGLGLLTWAGLAIRSWWLRRKQPQATVSGVRPQSGSEYIEVEYTVVSRQGDEGSGNPKDL